MSVRLQLPQFDGAKGPVAASQFVESMDAIFNANEVPQARRPHLAMTCFLIDTPAHTWLTNDKLDNPAKFTTWAEMRIAIIDEFCRPLTLAETQSQRKLLVLQPNEKANAFYNRIRYFHHNKDFQILPAVKATDAYKLHFNARVKEDFVNGLPQNMLNRLAAVNLHTVTNEDLVTTVLQAQAVSGVQSSVNAVSSNFRPKNRNTNSNAPPMADRSKLPDPEALKRRKLNTCGRCKQWVKHRKEECIVPLDSNGRPIKPYKRNFKSKKVNAVDSNDQQEQDPPSSYPDPLNGLMG